MRWWLEQGDYGCTSVNFLIDRKSVIRHIHHGDEYVKGNANYASMKDKNEELLKEKLPIVTRHS